MVLSGKNKIQSTLLFTFYLQYINILFVFFLFHIISSVMHCTLYLF